MGTTMTVEEVATFLKLSPITVYRELEKKRLPGFKVGNQWRIKEAILHDWIDEKSGWKNRFLEIVNTFQEHGRKLKITDKDVLREIKAVRREHHARRS